MASCTFWRYDIFCSVCRIVLIYGVLLSMQTSAVKMLPRVTSEGLVYVVDAEDFR
jgi:hypothetical protein